MNKNVQESWIILLLLAVTTSACAGFPVRAARQTGVLPPPAVETISLQPSSTAQPSLPPPTLEPTVEVTPAPHPLSIEGMRSGSYPGSDIVLEQELDPGANYRRYYASYLSEGLKIYALLTIPNAEMPAGGYPAIVFNHGYIPPDVYRTTERYVNYVDFLARAGYIVFRIDYRGHDRSEGQPTGAYGHPGYTTDVLNAVASLKRLPQANPEKIGMWGHSMGGFLTMRAMVISPDIKAGVIWAGVVASYPDMLNNWRRAAAGPTPTPSGGRRWRFDWLELYGTPEENPQFWASISANSYLADLSGPVQFHHGTFDTDVSVQFSLDANQQVLDAGGISEVYIYDGDNHNLSGYFTTAMNRTIAFYDKHLK